jgi:predicted nucleic acid-binding protein
VRNGRACLRFGLDHRERSDTAWSNELPDEPAALAAIVYAELLVGAKMAESRRRAEGRRAKIDALLATMPVVDF